MRSALHPNQVGVNVRLALVSVVKRQRRARKLASNRISKRLTPYNWFSPRFFRSLNITDAKINKAIEIDHTPDLDVVLGTRARRLKKI